MKIYKSGTAETGGCLPAEELDAINAFAKGKLTAQEVYTFSVLLCDNEVDRDNERFSEQTLEELRELFVGKTGLFDHEWSAGKQAARIYRTELVTDCAKTNVLGAPYMYLKGYAYILRLPENESLIAEIEGGIKRETSVGCAVARKVCSICGEEAGSAACRHVPGETYAGKLCFTELRGAVDAYEWSFVAVPAQRNAGVTKAAVPERFAAEYETLKTEAALGREYLAELKGEVKRLGLICDKALYESIAPGLEHMDAPALKALRDTLTQRVAELLPLQTQLPGAEKTVRFDGAAYLV